MSIEGGEMDKKKHRNFLSVASRASSDHLVYERDLVALLVLAVKVHDRSLALDLGEYGSDNFVVLCRQLDMQC
jgi:hypothetical protein